MRTEYPVKSLKERVLFQQTKEHVPRAGKTSGSREEIPGADSLHAGPGHAKGVLNEWVKRLRVWNTWVTVWTEKR